MGRGALELPPSRGSVWVAGHWISQGGNWVWVNGAWNVSEPTQTETAPPQPPAPGSVPAGQTVPTPSSPPPLLSAEYGPDGTVRAVDQPPVTTDYGPLDYSAASPGYYYWDAYPYWDGYPWVWGYPGAYFGDSTQHD